MSYKSELRKQIMKLENELKASNEKNTELENRILKLKIAELEEELREDGDSPSNQILLKG